MLAEEDSSEGKTTRGQEDGLKHNSSICEYGSYRSVGILAESTGLEIGDRGEYYSTRWWSTRMHLGVKVDLDQRWHRLDDVTIYLNFHMLSITYVVDTQMRCYLCV